MRNVLSTIAHYRHVASAASLTVVGLLLVAQMWPIHSSPTLERSMATYSQMTRVIDLSPQDGDDAEDSSEGLQITLGEGSQQPDSVQPLPATEARPLTTEEQQDTLNRMPPLATQNDDTQDFRLPPQSLPPPRTGQTIDETFPPSQEVAAPVTEPAGPLEVLRYAPEGEIRVAPFLNVTFNQPMAPLSTVEALSQQDVPVQLTPELPGVWKWLGTKTLSFEYDSDLFDRFPMATEYVATVPAGTESVVGGVLAETVTWSFRTPPPRVRMSHPGYGPQPLDPLLFVAFDQRIDPEAVLATIRVTAGGQEFPVRLASEEEIDRDPAIKRLVESNLEARWLAFRAERAFPTNTTVNVNIGPKTPSAEGPLTTTDVQSFSFQTYAPLRIDRHDCGWGDQCPPYSPFNIIFNNPIDEDLFEESLIQVDPAIPGMVVEMFGNTLSVSGATAGRTTYRVTIEGSIQDIFGQNLGNRQTLTFETGPAPSYFTGPQGELITLDPTFSQPRFPIYSVNYERLRVRAWAVKPEDWPAYQSYKRDYYRTDTPPEPSRSAG
ncbi:MAG: Ig-like domain-containing protein [Caldilineaceae bacterium]|nr:Ig-like domain-containing protein [Caldilineaceae bacterium]